MFFIDFFIRRPVFSSVCSIIIVLVGAICIPRLPIAQYPQIAPPTVNITANYNGANSKIVENTITNILERQINGVQGVKYITSTSSNSGVSNITLTFDLERDEDLAAVDVQNRISAVEAQLPAEVRQTGVSVTKRSTSIVLALGLYSDKGEYNDVYLSNYADLYLTDTLKRLKGVGDVVIFGERRYAMRLWLDPTRLASRGLTAQDVVSALSEQNLQVGAGQLGQPPSPSDQKYQLSLTAVGRLKDPAEFGDIVLKTGDDGSLIKVSDVGRVELGAQSYDTTLRFNRQQGVGLGIYQLPGSNSLDVAHEVKEAMKQLAKAFPPGMKYQVAFDTTNFVEESMVEVVKTLFEALVLVVLVIFIFLQNWQSTLIPAITIPVSLIGTFIFVKAFNFSINSLTLFGLTLATGLVVDDAIVVIENIIRNIQEEHLPPLRAASVAMREVFGAVVATSLVLMAVFIPVAFFPGTTGQLYKQFALTIAFSIAISTFNAVTLTPALSALLLKDERSSSNWFFDRVNWVINGTRQGYQANLSKLIRFKYVVLALFVASLAATYWLFKTLPVAFLPEEDLGYFITIVQTPEGSSLNYTNKVMEEVENILQDKNLVPEVTNTFAVGGFGFTGSTPNSGVVFSTLKPWSERKKVEESLSSVLNRIRPKLLSLSDAFVLPVPPPAIQGLSSFGGFSFQLQNKTNLNRGEFTQAALELIGRASKEVSSGGTPLLVGLRPSISADTPQLLVEVDRNKAKSLQVRLQDIFNTLQIFLGSQYVNDFNAFERSYRVYVQADSQFRTAPDDIQKLYVRSQTGQMIPLSNLVKVTSEPGPQVISHYNLFPSIEITGSPGPGVSSGQALEIMEKLARETLPQGIGYEWSALSLEEIQSGGQAPLIFGLGLIFVFLVLAAQYESYVDPLIILLAVPLAILGALAFQMLRGLANDVYCQIGLVMLIGLASKNSILIVEFANQLRERGASITKAALQSSQERLRPILMTSLAFIFGMFPLINATGAGAASRRSLGTAVSGGLLVSTFLSLFIVPILYIVIISLEEQFKKRGKHKQTETGEPVLPEPIEEDSYSRS